MRKTSVFCLLTVLAVMACFLALAPAAEAGGYGRGVAFVRGRSVAFIAAPAYAAYRAAPVLAVEDGCHAAALAAPVVGYNYAAPLAFINAGYAAPVRAFRADRVKAVREVRIERTRVRAVRGY